MLAKTSRTGYNQDTRESMRERSGGKEYRMETEELNQVIDRIRRLSREQLVELNLMLDQLQGRPGNPGPAEAPDQITTEPG